MRTFLVVSGLVICGACTREPAEELCPAAVAGDLVVTELRADQGGTYPQFVELYNASGLTLDLEGTVVDVLSIDGGTHLRLLVRAPLPVADGGYVALSDAATLEGRPYLAYTFGADFEQNGTHKDLPSAGRITVSACGETIDQLDFEGVPSEGTYSLGADPPTADANDVDGAWCADTTPSSDTTEIGLPGTPGAANTPCVTP